MESHAYWNGAWVPSGNLSIPVDDLGFAMGITVVEKLRTFRGELFRVEDHLKRFRRSVNILGWDAAGLGKEIEAALAGFMERNSPSISAGDDWSVEVFVTPGMLATAAKPTVCVRGYPLPFEIWAEQLNSGVEAMIVDVKQVPENCWPAELKCRSRMHYFLADREAAARQPGSRAILLDQDGNVGEGTTANVVAYFADRGLVTPLRSKVLPGVTQEVLYELADSLAIPHDEVDLLPGELAEADEIYFTSTSICLLPVVRLDGVIVGTGEPGLVYRRLLAAWSQFVGVDIAQQALDFRARR